MTVVHNLATGETRTYSCPPRQAVIAAYAQDRGDNHTWDYETRYGSRVVEGERSWGLGDWATLKGGE